MNILRCKLLVKYKGNNVSTKSDSVQVYSGGTGQTTLQFIGGFKHKAGASEIVKIYAPVSKSGAPQRILRTTLFPLDGFEWIDGEGAIYLEQKMQNSSRNQRDSQSLITKANLSAIVLCLLI